jgi:uncharacterized membrane protein YoaK (UPF0700 family)
VTTRATAGRGLLILLTVGSGATDALSYLGLGKGFPANMTGNTVLLAIGTATGKYEAAVRSAVALGGFVLGALLAGLVTRPAEDWTRPMRGVLVGEFAVQVAALAWWLTLPASPAGATRLALIGMFGATMGAQSALVSRLPVGVSTTYITGTWTSVSTWASTRLHGRAADERQPDAPLQITVVVCYFAAALAAGFLFRVADGAVAAIPAGAVAIVSLALAAGATPRGSGGGSRGGCDAGQPSNHH